MQFAKHSDWKLSASSNVILQDTALKMNFEQESKYLGYTQVKESIPEF